MNKDDKIYVAGHLGMVGSAILRRLERDGYRNIITRTHQALDLTRQTDVETFFASERPRFVFNAAARVGGIFENMTHQAEFIYVNTAIGLNLIHAAFRNDVTRLLNLGSTCIYPRAAAQPLQESQLLTGPLEPTNEGYAIAKIATIKLCRYYNEQYGTDYISLMPTNMYGPHDNFDTKSSHVLPAMIRKFHEAKQQGLDHVTLWGTGTPMREFLHVDDLADAALYFMIHKGYSEVGELVNVGSGEEVTIRHLAELIREVVGYTGALRFDAAMPDGTPRKVSDLTRLHALGWQHKTPLKAGVKATYRWFLEHGLTQ